MISRILYTRLYALGLDLTSQRECASKQLGSHEQLAAIMRSTCAAQPPWMDGWTDPIRRAPDRRRLSGHSAGRREGTRDRLENPSTALHAH